jgi:hypothetical protein
MYSISLTIIEENKSTHLKINMYVCYSINHFKLFTYIYVLFLCYKTRHDKIVPCHMVATIISYFLQGSQLLF